MRRCDCLPCRIVDELRRDEAVAAIHSEARALCRTLDDSTDARMAAIAEFKGPQSVQAKSVGAAIAEKAKAAGVSSIVFDRAGYRYGGQVKKLADAAREGGLAF